MSPKKEQVERIDDLTDEDEEILDRVWSEVAGWRPIANAYVTHGGAGSGNFGHKGRPGERGGSGEGDGPPGETGAARRSRLLLKEIRERQRASREEKAKTAPAAVPTPPVKSTEKKSDIPDLDSKIRMVQDMHRRAYREHDWYRERAIEYNIGPTMSVEEAKRHAKRIESRFEDWYIDHDRPPEGQDWYDEAKSYLFG